VDQLLSVDQDDLLVGEAFGSTAPGGLFRYSKLDRLTASVATNLAL
jgi:hypothetical protein